MESKLTKKRKEQIIAGLIGFAIGVAGTSIGIQIGKSTNHNYSSRSIKTFECYIEEEHMHELTKTTLLEMRNEDGSLDGFKHLTQVCWKTDEDIQEFLNDDYELTGTIHYTEKPKTLVKK